MNNILTPKFCHLHQHSCYSILDGLGLIPNIVKKASELGFKYLALTDHSNIDGAIQFQECCIKNNITPIIGVEFFIVADSTVMQKEKRGHLTAWIKNETGWSNVLKMLSYANLYGFYSRPRIDINSILDHCEGLCIGTACTNSFINCDFGIDLFDRLYNKIGEDLYLEIMPHDYEGQKELNLKCMRIASNYGLKLIATNDCHYINEEDSETHEVLLAMQTKTTWNNQNRWKFNVPGLNLNSVQDMIKKFDIQNVLEYSIYRTALSNTIEVAEKCSSFKIKKKSIDLPVPPRYTGMNEDEVFIELCQEGFKKKFGIDVDLKSFIG